ncbi:hypothetical protein NC653_028680 [Populus alba x Populus x berolinensis]|uniref:Uncharacterized protein n=1 Tax=Populus alba x Populus x berolinensis TaxID=444605 RepID=A0AAD6M098_9ROSI|nr:hypothetical protein NC653_028680 [Populus alba x Populus x berolinensis]
MALTAALYDILEHPSSMLGVCTEMVGFLGPLWISFLIGLIIGWSWKPKWVTRESDKLTSYFLVRSSNRKASWVVDNNNNKNSEHHKPSHVPPTKYEDCRSQLNEEQSNISSLVTEEDLKHLN